MATDRAGAAPVLDCRDLRKVFGDRVAVEGVGFTIGPSETYGLLGPNGAGKTTSISMICGLLVRDGGTVVVDGRPLDVDAVAAKRAVGFVPQDLAIYPELSARENLRFFGQLYGLSGGELRSRIDEVLQIIGLSDRADERTDAFSGGMKRRLNIGKVGAAVAMLIGAVANNSEQAGSIGLFAGLGVGAIGGSMVPPEIFPEPMATISWLTPHRSALDGFRELIAGADLVAILPQLGVLLAVAALILAAATWQLRRAITR